MNNPFENDVACRYGAPMGRADYPLRDDVIPENGDTLYLARIRWTDGDYDQGGAYWGRGSDSDDVWCMFGLIHEGEDEDDFMEFFRAKNLDAAIEHVRREVRPAPHITPGTPFRVDRETGVITIYGEKEASDV